MMERWGGRREEQKKWGQKCCLYDVLAAFVITAEISCVVGRSESEGEGATMSGSKWCVVVLCRVSQIPREGTFVSPPAHTASSDPATWHLWSRMSAP